VHYVKAQRKLQTQLRKINKSNQKKVYQPIQFTFRGLEVMYMSSA